MKCTALILSSVIMMMVVMLANFVAIDEVRHILFYIDGPAIAILALTVYVAAEFRAFQILREPLDRNPTAKRQYLALTACQVIAMAPAAVVLGSLWPATRAIVPADAALTCLFASFVLASMLLLVRSRIISVVRTGTA